MKILTDDATFGVYRRNIVIIREDAAKKKN